MGPLVAIVGDVTPERQLDPPSEECGHRQAGSYGPRWGNSRNEAPGCWSMAAHIWNQTSCAGSWQPNQSTTELS